MKQKQEFFQQSISFLEETIEMTEDVVELEICVVVEAGSTHVAQNAFFVIKLLMKQIFYITDYHAIPSVYMFIPYIYICPAV